MNRKATTLRTCHFLFILIIASSSTIHGQITKTDSLGMAQVITDFSESIVQKDSIRFDTLFFSESVSFIGIMSQDTEWSIKKGYPEFQGLAVSDHRAFISEICKSDKKQVERFYNIEMSTDGAIGSISFDYSFLSNDKMTQWGNEKWNMVKDQERWLITDVIYSIHFPHVEPFPFE